MRGAPRVAWMSVLVCVGASTGASRAGEPPPFLHQGQPFFPIGLWSSRIAGDSVDSRRPELAAAGFNVLHRWYRDVTRSSLDADRSYGLNVISWAYAWLGDPATHATAIEGKINEIRDHPAFFAWDTRDEAYWGYTLNPSGCGFTRDGLTQGRSFFNARDPTHPVLYNLAPYDLTLGHPGITFEGNQLWTSIGNAFSMDRYPADGNYPHTDLTPVGRCVDDLKAIVGEGVPIYFILQGCGLGEWSGVPNPASRPNLIEDRFMAYSSVIHGSKGILYYGTSYLDSPSCQMWADLKAVAGELRSLHDVLCKGITSTDCSVQDPACEWILKLHEGYRYLIVANRTSSDRSDVRMRIPCGSSPGAEALFEGRTIVTNRGEFQDSFEPWGTHVYRIPPESVQVDLGGVDQEQSLTHIRTGVSDGDTEPTTIGGREARRNIDAATDYYFYFGVSDTFAWRGNRPDLYVTIDYYDSGTGALGLQYDSAAGDDLAAQYKRGGSVTLSGTNRWKRHTFHVTDAYFGNRQNGGADFRIAKSGGGEFCLDVVAVRDVGSWTRSVVSIDLGSQDVTDGMTRIAVADGDTIAANAGGLDCRRCEDPAGSPADLYIYFGVDDTFAFQGGRPDLYVTIHYYDAGTGSLMLQYDSNTGSDLPARYKDGGLVALTGTNTWKRHTYHIADAWFGNRQNNGADFRIAKYGGGLFWLDLVYVRDFCGGRPCVRMVPPPGGGLGQPFRDLFEHPAEWERARSQVDALGYYLHILDRFSDDELNAWLPQIPAWGLKLSLETGALKEWCQNAQACFNAEKPILDRIAANAGHIDTIAIDEPFFNVRWNQYGSDTYAVNETAEWIRLMRQALPRVQIGSIEPYPAIPRADLEWWIVNLNDRCATIGVQGPDFLCIDADWRRLPAEGSWADVKQLEDFCRARSIPFSLIYWAADKATSTADLDWYMPVMAQGRAYDAVGGRPDEYDVQSWLDCPTTVIPETADYGFTRSVLDFTQEFVRGEAASIDLGPPSEAAHGVALITVSGGNTVGATIGGRSCRRNSIIDQDRFFCFTVADAFAFQGGRPDLSVTIDYFDTGTGTLELQYDSSDGAAPDPIYKSGGGVRLNGTKRWKRYTHSIADAYFGRRQAGGGDFRIVRSEPGLLYLDLVRVAAGHAVLPFPANDPTPANAAAGVSADTNLSWTAGSGAVSHNVYFGTASNGTFRGNQTTTTFDPGILATETTYYWRVDEVSSGGVATGYTWRFRTGATPGKATNPNPPDQATGASIHAILSWTPGSGAGWHGVYWGTESPGTFQGYQQGTAFDPGPLTSNTTYYWRIDEVNAGGTTTGDVWSFTTAVVSAGDHDGDGDVDLADFQSFQECFNGPNRPYAQSGCQNADFDTDADVDLEDFTRLTHCFNGPNNPPACR